MTGSATPVHLLTEYEREPKNINPAVAPRFSWQIQSTEQATTQCAYRILVASSSSVLSRNTGDVWDTGKVRSNRTTAIVYNGSPLEPETAYVWKVQIWTEKGASSAWSAVHSFTTALANSDSAWEGRWITYDPIPRGQERGHSPLLRTEFTLENKQIESARAHVSTIGWGELYLNGAKVGTEVLNPGVTDYEEQTLYSSYDVTDQLFSGQSNSVGLWLGRGFYDKSIHDWTGLGSPRGILQLNVEYNDGSTDTVVTDTSWTADGSPITKNDIYDGETYDAQVEQPGWASPNFDDGSWSTVTAVQGPSSNFDWHPQRLPPIKVTNSIRPVDISQNDGDWVVDFGQTIAGWVELTMDGAREGQDITIEHAEVLVDDGELSHDTGNLNMEDLRDADATDTYIAKGDDVETYEPRFTYHGFRHVRVFNYPGELSPDDIAAKVVRTEREANGRFSASNDDLNDVHHMVTWGLRTNTHSIPTDCPNRDERHGWTEIFRGASTEYYEYETEKTHRFYEKWMRDHRYDMRSKGMVAVTIPDQVSEEDPNWSKSTVQCVWHMYEHTGDKRVLADNYPMMTQYVDHWQSRATEEDREHIVPAKYNTFGDWLAPTTEEIENDPAMLNTFAHYQTTKTVANAAAALGKYNEARMYENRASTIKTAFNNHFYDETTNTYGSGDMGTFAMAMHGGLVPKGAEQAVADELASTIRNEYDNKIGTGTISTQGLLMSALMEYGYEDLVYHLVSQPERPGWVYMARNGATTLWERWDSDTQIGSGMNSFNHRLWMEVGEWFYTKLVGIQPATPGFERVLIKPVVPTELEHASAETETIRGKIAVAWEQYTDEFVLEVTIPGNTTGEVWVLANHQSAVYEGDTCPAEDATGVTYLRHENDYAVFEVSAGSYTFHSDSTPVDKRFDS
ncbi:alpha-L-rhamnosidase [Halocatena marina]|uniref:alpha-L-rhamnosidase n=1 Tax=Halocatena marina TaxID=2934937 RepID=UPI00200EA2AF|nr:alpha-L-rhamnosidase [Halocatena marina]